MLLIYRRTAVTEAYIMIRTVVLAWSVVAVCIQPAVSLETKPGNESTANFVTNVTETSPLVNWKYLRRDLDHRWVQIVLCCDGNIAPVSHYNASLSTFVRCPACEVDAPDDAPFCIKTYFNSTGVGMQSFIVPAEGKVKIGTDEIDVENITQLYDRHSFTPKPEPVSNSTDPPPSEPTSAATVSTTVFATVVGVLVGCIAVTLVAAVGVFICYRKKKKRLEEVIKGNTTLRGNSPDAEAGSLPQIGVHQEPTTDDPPPADVLATDDPPPADVVLATRKTPSPVLRRGPLESPPSQTPQAGEPASPALHVAPGQNTVREMLTSEPNDPEAPQASRVGEDPNQNDTTAIV